MKKISGILCFGAVLAMSCQQGKGKGPGNPDGGGDTHNSDGDGTGLVNLGRDELFTDEGQTWQWHLPPARESLFASRNTAELIHTTKSAATDDCPIRTHRLILPGNPQTIGFRPRFDFTMDWQAPAVHDRDARLFDIRIRYALLNSSEVKQASFPVYVHDLNYRREGDGFLYSTEANTELGWYMEPVEAPVQWVEVGVCQSLSGITRFDWTELGLIVFLGSSGQD